MADEDEPFIGEARKADNIDDRQQHRRDKISLWRLILLLLLTAGCSVAVTLSFQRSRCPLGGIAGLPVPSCTLLIPLPEVH